MTYQALEAQSGSVLSAQVTAKFWNRIAKRYAAKPVKNQKAYQHKLAVTRRFLSANANVLELGCGTGSTALAHAAYVGSVRATDVSPAMIEIANGKRQAAGTNNVVFACTSVDDELSSGQTYDVVMAHSLLHLLPDWRRTIPAIHALLRPGGVFVTNTPCLKEVHGWLRPIAPVGATLGLLPYLSFFSEKELRGCLDDAGFEPEYAWQADSTNGLFLVCRKAP